MRTFCKMFITCFTQILSYPGLPFGAPSNLRNRKVSMDRFGAFSQARTHDGTSARKGWPVLSPHPFSFSRDCRNLAANHTPVSHFPVRKARLLTQASVSPANHTASGKRGCGCLRFKTRASAGVVRFCVASRFSSANPVRVAAETRLSCARRSFGAVMRA